MAESSSATACTSTSTSTSTSANSKYDVFISHRGLDVKKSLASHLYRWLLSCGLRVFLDQPELERGDYLTPQIHDAIQSASVHVAIFSAGYADSTWCLNELVEMLDTKKVIIPVFYHVEPSELRWTRSKKGKYAESLDKLEKKTGENPQTHEQKLRYSSSQIENWRQALSNVAEIIGFELKSCNGDEGELVDKVVKQVLKKVNKPALDVAKYPTGLDDKVNHFENTVLKQLQQSGKPQILGIVGLGGVGKTTLSKKIFNRKRSDYSKSCFLSEVRDNVGKGCLLSLQKTLLRSLNVPDVAIERVGSVDEGKGMIKTHLSSVNALVVLDDVDDVDQVDSLLPIYTVLPSDCMILITSRNIDILIRSKIEESSIYKLTGLDEQHSRELFCLHAFNQPDPLPEFESLVVKFLETCNGLPLSLKVIGALLYGKKLCDWEDELRSLEKILPTEIQERLRRSYLSLNSEEQNIFLDVACFFRGENKDRAMHIWDGSGWQGRRRFQNLRNRCLVEVDSKNKIQMHDHLRDMGRVIAKNPELPCRLWRWTEDTIDDLSQLPQGRVVRGIVGLRAYHGIDVNDVFGDIRMKRLQLLHTEGALVERILAKVDSPNLKWLRWDNCPHSSLPSSISMRNLRVLQLAGLAVKTLWENESQVPLQLRDLEVEAPLSNIPKSIGQLKYLERILIRSSRRRSCGIPRITKLPKEFCFLQSLKVLVLIACFEIRSLPKCFGNLTNLQHVDLSRCYRLKRLPESFVNLTNLHHIDLSHCSALKRLPDSFDKLIKLQYLSLAFCNNLAMSSETLGNINTIQYINLNGCEKIEILPQQLVYQRSLEQLYFSRTNVKEVPGAIGELSCLEVVELGGGPLLDKLPASLGYLRNLKRLGILFCAALKCLPASLGLLTQLTQLSVHGCPLITELPFKEVKGERKTLNDMDYSIDMCTFPRLKKLSLLELGISEVSLPEGVCCSLEGILISFCTNLIEIGKLPNMLRRLSCSDCHNLRKIDGLYGLPKLESLRLFRLMELQELPHMGTLVSLTCIIIEDCAKLKSIRGLGGLKKLREFRVYNCPELEELEGLKDCPSLQHLIVSGQLYVQRCQRLSISAAFNCVRQLYVQRCPKLEELGDSKRDRLCGI